ncbi:MAG TPA: hypothetical protein PLJ38_02300 [bacterium]|nr:hypothetical protein [bacterium]
MKYFIFIFFVLLPTNILWGLDNKLWVEYLNFIENSAENLTYDDWLKNQKMLIEQKTENIEQQNFFIITPDILKPTIADTANIVKKTETLIAADTNMANKSSENIKINNDSDSILKAVDISADTNILKNERLISEEKAANTEDIDDTDEIIEFEDIKALQKNEETKELAIKKKDDLKNFNYHYLSADDILKKNREYEQYKKKKNLKYYRILGASLVALALLFI